MCFHFLMYLHAILYKYFSVSENLLPGHVNRHSKQLIHKIDIINIFNYNFNFSHSFNYNATCDDNLVTPERILTLYTELIIFLVNLKNGFFDNFDYFWKTVALMVCSDSFNLS